jgi:hypothetical protein
MWDGWNGLRLSPNHVTVPRFGDPHLVFRGPLEALTRFDWTGHWQLPHPWFPDDRAWCVGTNTDSYDTIVGGSQDLVERILASPDLETLRVEPDDLAVVSGECQITR